MKYVIIFSLSILSYQTEASNALWNYGPDVKAYGFWVFPIEGKCPEIRTQARPLVFGTKLSSGNFNVSELYTCIALPKANTLDDPKLCKSGAVTVVFQKSTNTYEGNYDFVMSDGSNLKGKFKAEYCAP